MTHTSSTTVYERLLEGRAIGRPRVREKDQVHKDMQICNGPGRGGCWRQRGWRELFVRLSTSLSTNGHDGKYGPKQKHLLRQNTEV